MSKFIDVSNQNMLWNTMQKLELFRNSFSEEYEKMSWFKIAISNIYERNREVHLSDGDLQTLNRESIKYMIQILKTPVSTTPVLQNNKSDPYEALKDEYESMKKPKEPPNRPEFSEQIDDTTIENIGELIEKQRSDRARDLSVHNIDAVELKDADLHNNAIPKKSVSWGDESQISALNDRIQKLETQLAEVMDILHKNGTYNQFSL